MKLHLPTGLLKAVFALFVGAAVVAPTYAKTYENGATISYTRDTTADALTGQVEASDGTEKFVSITGNHYYDYITIGDNDGNASGFAQFNGHVMSNGTITVHSDSFLQVIKGYSLDATGQDVIIGDEGETLKSMNPIASSTYSQPKFGGVISFYSSNSVTDNAAINRVLRVGSLTTYMGAYVNDVKTFIVDGGKDAARYATSSGDMDVRNNGTDNGYILTDISGNDITIAKGDFSLDTEYTKGFNPDGSANLEYKDYDKMNTGDYGYVNSLKIGVAVTDNAGKTVGEAGASTVKATNDLQVLDGIEIASGSKLDMNSKALETKSLSGQVTNASAFTVGTLDVVANYEKEDGTMGTPWADYEQNNGEKSAAKSFEAELSDITAQATATKGSTFDVMGTEGAYAITKVTGTVELKKGNFNVVSDGTSTGTIKLVDANSSVTLDATSKLDGMKLDGNGAGVLTLHGYTESFDGVENFAVVNLIVGGWDKSATGVNMTGAVLSEFTLNINFAKWDAAVKYEEGAQMTLVTGLTLTDAELVTLTTTLSTPALLTASEQEAASETPVVTGVALQLVKNDKNTYDVVATQVIPEPTTATLSLLALAGLAARRRRK